MIEQQILDGAPYGADEFFIFHGVVNYIDNHENGHQFKIWDAECEEWVFSELVDGWQYIRGRRSLSDIKTIVDLKKRIAELEKERDELKEAILHSFQYETEYDGTVYAFCSDCNAPYGDHDDDCIVNKLLLEAKQ